MFTKPKTKKACVVTIQPRDLRTSACPQSTPIDSFLCQRCTTPYDDKESLRMTSDIYMLFNQHRLDRMSRENLIEYFNNMAVRDSSLSSLKKRLSDDQLISVVKSRYIQQPTELLNWSRYLNSLADEQLRAVVAASQPQSTEPTAEPAQQPASE